MNAGQCQREDELLDALGRGFVGAELGAHLEACSSCSELHLVAGALLSDRVDSMAEAHVPAAGTMWWRIQLRHRRDAQATARRSLLVGQAVTLAIAVALMAALFGVELATGVRHVVDSIRVSTPLLVALATWVLLAPIAGWVAIRQK